MQNSILLNPYDVNGFSKAIELLTNNDELREKLSIGAFDSVSPFDINNSIESMEDIYCGYLEVSEKRVIKV